MDGGRALESIERISYHAINFRRPIDPIFPFDPDESGTCTPYLYMGAFPFIKILLYEGERHNPNMNDNNSRTRLRYSWSSHRDEKLLSQFVEPFRSTQRETHSLLEQYLVIQSIHRAFFMSSPIYRT